ncbi:carbohydrate kinase [Lutibacter sp.]|uniref:carbohydrate kinase family protein n=1 Tax=Lutibacter sp. TaxID=1925666 RepID=UPI002733F1C5|nr:carbohydrate kinase [Lutibacter sp.]MDP3314407.1 carbohydrate kinase [Lutibacter sp.]
MTNKKFNIVGIGELLWDMLPDGKELGGAPANFSYHCNYFGANSIIISALGNDEHGEEISSILKEKKLNYSINYVEKPTGFVSVKLANGIPSYHIHENVAWDFIELKNDGIEALKIADAICFGSLSQRSKTSYKAIHNALSTVPEAALKVFDINLRQSYFNKKLIEDSLKYANVLKLNDEELIVLRKMFDLKNTEDEACMQLLNQFNLKLVALTNGSKGSILYTKNEISQLSVPKVKVIDTIGAGDSFTAAMIMGMLSEKPLKQTHLAATEHASKVCMYKGGTPIL